MTPIFSSLFQFHDKGEIFSLPACVFTVLLYLISSHLSHVYVAIFILFALKIGVAFSDDASRSRSLATVSRALIHK
ncbi:hypothetical protein R3P38DRAFT_516133 [Favolaschia claudopus]|uniref:Uncharacterized protein n=1 Tax=Favolaschia claudopus TaxID=2862362 RepID=A0AAV9ZBD4_9AGAR